MYIPCVITEVGNMSFVMVGVFTVAVADTKIHVL